jgi:hypothetical protein
LRDQAASQRLKLLSAFVGESTPVLDANRKGSMNRIGCRQDFLPNLPLDLGVDSLEPLPQLLNGDPSSPANSLISGVTN